MLVVFQASLLCINYQSQRWWLFRGYISSRQPEPDISTKVQGAVHFDEYFKTQSPVDFFICFSLAAVAGNSGQSNYTAANNFLATLTAQRRRRGLAGSCIDLSAVYGVGYVAKAAREFDYELNPYTFVSIAEQDVDELFAEAVIAGQPQQDGRASGDYYGNLKSRIQKP
ncbi:hypothetical protein UA08_02206 [Talaromyces atroroseus]|uniref:Ketoreductase (KR) domain-containing protein n=1 Tax=Talaromyces atroroseus TaxID=1441469 RepID=A0A225ARW4_TALAT|nr:hypothetical protein UA08_02206 [Talaromyces atroroseus]OKL62243.1 hypothetical protein UA08_02206 [Talaromyces atroroseus]